MYDDSATDPNVIHEQKLKQAVHFVLGKTCIDRAEDLKVKFTKPFIGTATEVTMTVLELWAKDLESFARHAKRATITSEDVLLLVRRCPDLHALLSTEAKSLAAERTSPRNEAIIGAVPIAKQPRPKKASAIKRVRLAKSHVTSPSDPGSLAATISGRTGDESSNDVPNCDDDLEDDFDDPEPGPSGLTVDRRNKLPEAENVPTDFGNFEEDMQEHLGDFDFFDHVANEDVELTVAQVNDENQPLGQPSD